MATTNSKKRPIEDHTRSEIENPARKQRTRKWRTKSRYHDLTEEDDKQDLHDSNEGSGVVSDESNDSADESIISSSSLSDASYRQTPKKPKHHEEDLINGSADSDLEETFYDGNSIRKSVSSNTKSHLKRNDPNTFSTSLQKILGTKLSSTRRSDPVLSRSATARETSRRIVDSTLEDKARRQLRLERRAALEKGRVKDVLVASNSATAPTKDAETVLDILENERRLRKVAQRGVVKLFNAVRAAQIKAAEAQKSTKNERVLGIDKREAKVAELSRKGFLDLIASGGGGLRKGGLEEA